MLNTEIDQSGQTILDQSPLLHFRDDRMVQTFAFAGYGLDSNEVAARLKRLVGHSGRTREFLKDAFAAAREETVDISGFISERHQSRGLGSEEFVPAAPPVVSRKLLLVSTCVLRAAEFLQHASRRPLALANEAPGFSFTGTGVGALVAAACAASSSLEELHRLSIYVVRIAARVTVALEKTSRRIDLVPGPWSVEIRGTSAQAVAREIMVINQRHKLNPFYQIYLAVESPEFIIAAGPPSVLRDLLAEWAHLPWTLQPFPGEDLALHADHLTGIEDSYILFDVAAVDRAIPSRRRYSTGTLRNTNDSQPRTFGQLLSHAIHHLASDTAHVEQMTQSSQLDPRTDSPFLITEPVVDPIHFETPAFDPEEIAIVGMSGRFPGSEDVTSFWKSLMDGHISCQKIPSERFPVEEGSFVPYGCFLANVSGFDPAFFSISSREAARMDPGHRLAMMVAYEALEMAGIPVDMSRKHGNKTLHASTFIGQALNDYVGNLDQAGLDAYYLTSACRAFSSGRLNYHLGLTGEAITIDTACSSSAAAVTLACSALRNGDCELALAGGVNVMLSPQPYAGLSKGGFLSPSGPCKSFRSDADGYCRGEAVGILVLKRISDAIRDNDNILATVSGHARMHSVGASSIVHPHAPTQLNTYATACHNAGIQPCDISFVEAHGTGTIAGDTAEAESLQQFFGSTIIAENPLVIGAVKANIGHGEAAAGVSSLIKAILILQERIIPPQPVEPSAISDPWLPCLRKSNIRLCNDPTPLRSAADESRNIVMVNTFDASGGTTSIVLSEDPRSQGPIPTSDKSVHPLPWHIVTCSARTRSALQSNMKRLLAYLTEAGDSIHLRDIAYTLNSRRTHHALRQAWVIESVSQLCVALSEACESTTDNGNLRSQTRPQTPLILVCAGQGSFVRGMGRELCRTSPTFRHAIEDYSRICTSFEFPDFVPVLLDERDDRWPSDTTGQLAILAFELALVELWRSWGVEPEYVVGHSLGEYAALCIAGVLSTADTLYLVGRRAMLMEDILDHSTHGMLAVSSPTAFSDEDSDLFATTCELACINGPQSRVFGGPLQDLEHMRSRLGHRKPGLIMTPLAVDFAFHTSQMDPIMEAFSVICKTIRLRTPRIPIISTVECRIIGTNEICSPDYLVRHLRQPVHFYDTFLHNTKVLGSARYLEIGSDAVCSRMVRETLRDMSPTIMPSCKKNISPWKTMFEAMAWLHRHGHSIAWQALYQEHGGSLKLLPLPTYAFDLQSHWLPLSPAVPRAQPMLDDGSPHVMISSTLQRMENLSPDMRVFTSYTTYSALRDTINGHVVAGISVCPMSTIGDLAATAAWHSFESLQSGEVNPAAVITSAMEVTAPLTGPVQGVGRMVKVTTTRCANRHEGMMVEITLETTPGHFQNLASCKMHLLDEKQPRASSIQTSSSQIQAVIRRAREDGQVLRGEAIYRLFARLIDYSTRFQGLKTVYVMPSSTEGVIEAVGIAQLSPPRAGEKFTVNPYWLDALNQLPGLILNGDLGHEALGDDVFVIIGYEQFQWHGWAGDSVEYTSYTCLRPAPPGGAANMLADVVVFHQDTLILSCIGIIFSKMSRQAFLRVLRGEASDSLHLQNALHQSSAKRTAGKPQNGDNHILSRRPTGQELSQILISAAVEEAGLDYIPTDPTTSFLDMGLDSLNATAAVERVSKMTGIPLSFTILYHTGTFAALTRACQVMMEDPPSPTLDMVSESGRSETSGSRISTESTCASSGCGDQYDASQARKTGQAMDIDANAEAFLTTKRTIDATLEHSAPVLSGTRTTTQKGTFVPRPKVSLIHGRSSSTDRPVFLMPGGSGRSSDYIHLPPLDGGRRVYTISSPFLGCEESFICSIEQASTSYLESIRQIQAKGPYLLGGYSVGAAYAVEVARQLAAEGEVIDVLIIIDFPAENLYPKAWRPTPHVMATLSFKYTPHHEATYKAMHGYNMKPLPAAALPKKKTLLIWAVKCPLSDAAVAVVEKDVLKYSPEYHSLMQWFLFPRFHRDSSSGWSKIVGSRLEIEHLDIDHVQILNPQFAVEVARIINAALSNLN